MLFPVYTAHLRDSEPLPNISVQPRIYIISNDPDHPGLCGRSLNDYIGSRRYDRHNGDFQSSA